MRPVLLLVTADEHINSCVGLCHPEGCERDTGGLYLPSKAQLWLWDCWTDVWTRAAVKARELGALLYWINVGDGSDDNWHGSFGLITENEVDIIDHAKRCYQPGLDVADRVFFCRGTPAHVGEEGQLEELVARECGAEPDPQNLSRRSKWTWKLEASGVRIEAQHTPDSSSTRFYTRGGGANRTSAQAEMGATRLGWTMPDVAYFGHKHHPEDSGENYPVRTFFLPAFTLMTTHAKSRGYRPEVIGARLAICDNGSFLPLPLKDWTFAPEEDEPWLEPSQQAKSQRRSKKRSKLSNWRDRIRALIGR